MSIPHKFEATGDFLARLEGPERRALVPPDEIVSSLRLSRSDTLVDLGAGVGYLTFPAAERVSEAVALDVEPRMLEVLSARVRSLDRANVRLLRGDIAHLPFADGAADHVLAAFVYHEVDDHPGLVAEVSRVLRPGGLFTVVDFQKKPLPIGPPVSEKKTPGQVIRVVSRVLELVSRVERPAYYQLTFSKPRGRTPSSPASRSRPRAR